MWNWLRSIRQRATLERRLDAEIRFHVIVAIALAGAAGTASCVSARRGTALDPVTVLRGES